MNSKVPEGYQQTKVGVIPKDWKVVTVKDVFDFIKTYSNSRKDLSDIGDIEYLHYGDIHTKYKYHLDFDRNVLPKISSENFKANIEYAKDGDLFVADASEDYADIGKSVEIVNLYNKKVVSGLHTFLLRDKDNSFSNGYKGLVFYNKNVSKAIKKIATGPSVLGISKTNLGKLKIPLPPEPEQKKIADILTTWDKAIETQSALIKQKQQLKKGLMQKIFSQQVRFKADDGSDFPDWKEKKLGDVTNIVMGQSPDSTSYNSDGVGDYLIQGNADIKKRKTSPRIWTNAPTKKCKAGDIIMTVRAPVGAIAKSMHSACIGRGVCAISNNQHSNSNYMYQFLLGFENKWAKFEQGSTFTAVNTKDVKSLKLSLPIIQEQAKIANLLTISDNEITKLEQALDVLKKQKKGLMQKLLTGQIRVTIN